MGLLSSFHVLVDGSGGEACLFQLGPERADLSIKCIMRIISLLRLVSLLDQSNQLPQLLRDRLVVVHVLSITSFLCCWLLSLHAGQEALLESHHVVMLSIRDVLELLVPFVLAGELVQFLQLLCQLAPWGVVLVHDVEHSL